MFRKRGSDNRQIGSLEKILKYNQNTEIKKKKKSNERLQEI